MTTEQATSETVRQESWLRRNPGFLACVAVFTVLPAILIGLVLWFDGVIEQTKADTAAELREKYGVEVVVPSDRHKGATVWTIDGDERNCVWDGDTLTLACLGPTFTYTEIERKR